MRMRSTVVVVGVVALLGGAAALAQREADARLRSGPILALQETHKSWAPPPVPTQGKDKAVAPSSLPAMSPPHAEDDPVEAVEAFVRRNAKEADESIKALTQEAEALRGRLSKVEAALAKWQAVSRALQPTPPAAASEPPTAAPELTHIPKDGPLSPPGDSAVPPTVPPAEPCPSPDSLPSVPSSPVPANVPPASPDPGAVPTPR